MSGSNLLSHGFFPAFATVFVGGFLTSLTPCVYPLIPITVSLFGARGEDVTRGRALLLASSYVGGLAAMYSALGIVVGLTGAQFGRHMASPVAMVPIAIVFLAMAASMFGAFELALPPALQTRLSSVGGRGFFGAFAMGLVAGIIAAPCTGPVLASVLAFVATTRSVAIGGSLLFTYALGMGVLFFVITAFAVSLPKSGAWMESVKGVFGVVMVVAALYFLRNVFAPLGRYGSASPRFLEVQLALVAAGVALGGVHLSFHDGWPTRLRKAAGILAMVIGLIGTIGYVLTPKPLLWTKGEKNGVTAARAAHKPAVIDFFADYCLPCKELDLRTFGNPTVAAELQRFQLVKMDMTDDDDPAVKDVTARYHADTLPTVVLLDSDGKIVETLHQFVTADEFLPLLQKVR